MKLRILYITLLSFISLIISCASPKDLKNEHLEYLNYKVHEKLITVHNDTYKGEHNSFFLSIYGKRRKKFIYKITPITNAFNATFRDTIGKHSENLPYEYLIEGGNLFLIGSKKSVLNKKLIEALWKRKLIDSTLYDYGRKNSPTIELTEKDTLYFKGNPIKPYVIDENKKNYFYKVDTTNQKIKIRPL